MGANLLAYGKNVVGLEGEPIDNSADVVLEPVGTTGTHQTSKNMSNYKFLVLALRGTATGGWASVEIIPYEVFKQLNTSSIMTIIEINNIMVYVHYVDDTHISVDQLPSSRGFSIWGIN